MKRAVVDYLFELGNLKRVKRSGWWLIGIKDPESVAEHSFRAAAVGYFLAKAEGADEKKVILASLFNDSHEARLNDLHKIGHRYIDFRKAETAAFDEQMSVLPKEMSEELKTAFSHLQKQDSIEGIVARDADLLECALQAREYIKQGFSEAQDWLDNIRGLLKTESAVRMMEQIESADPNNWWHGLKKIER